ncbi:MFS transporter [Salinibacterium sp. ZJ77]|uniref:MFS transporter n=1 Tax=Salinibacterium sp. ZJ77 TaxID=2708337 RepID=UPI00141E7176|nr:MFS transporter [Salinibacterium sp. ZJ77]
MTDNRPATPPPTARTGAVRVMGLDLREDADVPRRRIFAWALWDWATQPFNTVLLTFVWVPLFLTTDFFLDPAVVAAADRDAEGNILGCDGSNSLSAYCTDLGSLAVQLGWGITAAGVLIALLAPVLGQRADAAGRTKLSLAVFTGLLVLAQLGMFFVSATPDMFWMGVVLIAMGSVFGEIAGVSYNALLVSVSTPRTVGKVSGLGWGFGYLGGIIALIVIVALNLAGVLDFDNGFSFQLIALGGAVWTIIFSIPILKAVPEPEKVGGIKKVNFFMGYVELGRSIARLWRDARHTFWFLLASAVYRDGLSAVFTFGAVIAAQVFGFKFIELVLFGIVLNLVAGVSTILAGRLDDRFGPKPVILVAIGGLVVCCLTVFIGAGLGNLLFWVAGIVLAAFVGPAQAASRSFLARVTPAGHEGEVFGLYATTGRATGWMASLLWGVFIAAAANQTLYGILGIALVLAVGFVLLCFVRPPARVES